jgi:hypothetical protein
MSQPTSRRSLMGGIWAIVGAAWIKARALGAEASEKGRLLLVNAVGGQGKAFFEINGEDVNPSGFAAGRTAGWFQYEAKVQELSAEHDPLGETAKSLKVEPGSTQALILRAVKVPSSKPGRPAVMAVAWHPMKFEATKQKKAQGIDILSIAAQELSLDVGGETVKLAPDQRIFHPLGEAASFVALQLAAPAESEPGSEPQTLTTLNMEDRQRVACVLFDDESRPGLIGIAVFDVK